MPLEDAVHDHGAGLDHGPDLFPVHLLGHARAGVPDESGDLFQRNATVGEQRHEAVPEHGYRSPWASPPLIAEASGPMVYLLMSYSQAEEVSEYAAQLARSHGLVCFDPQGETLRP